jgi:hypothetical protein
VKTRPLKRRQQIFFIFLFVLINPTLNIAQGTLFEAKSEDIKSYKEESKEKLKKVKANRSYFEVKCVKINNPKNIEKEGKLKINLPEYQQSIDASPRYVEFTDDDNYIWSGELKHKPTLQKGNIQIIAEKGEVFGYINFPNANYLIQDFGETDKGRLTYLLKSNEKELQNNSCGSDNHQEVVKKDSLVLKDEVLQVRSTGCPPAIRVLVLYTTNAYNANPNIWQIATTAISQINNTVLPNSDINDIQLKYVLTGTEFLAFNEVPNITTTHNNLKNDSTAQSLRGQYNADLVILFTQYTYNNGYVGYAFINDNTSDINKAYGIVSINNALDHTFAHEIGHLMGCRHQDDFSTYSARGYQWTEYGPGFQFIASHKTIMNTSAFGSISHFSNPNINYGWQYPQPTGTNINKCAEKILQHAAPISNFDPDNDLCTFIAGPSYIYNTTQIFTWCGQSSYTIQAITWEYSTNGYNYVNFGNSTCASKMGNTFPPYYYTIFIKMTATLTAGNSSVLVSRVMPVTNWSWYNYAKQEISVENRTVKNEIILRPNPANDIVVIENIQTELNNIPYRIYNIQGQIVASGFGDVSTDEMLISISSIPTGMYTLSIYPETKGIHVRLIKTP